VAAATGCAVGTAKSRVFRARRQLQAWLMGEEKATSRQPESRRDSDTVESHARLGGHGLTA
jgi:RNA polymerase sigma-70 factor (ECF subfamily)